MLYIYRKSKCCSSYIPSRSTMEVSFMSRFASKLGQSSWWSTWSLLLHGSFLLMLNYHFGAQGFLAEKGF